MAIEEKSALLKNIEKEEKLKFSYLSHHASKLVSLRDVKIMYGEKVACKKVDFIVEKGDRIAICGKNGSAKSNLLKLICGEKLSFQGDFFKVSNLLISYVSQDSSFLQGNLSTFAVQNEIDESLFKTILRKLDFSREQFAKDMRYFSEGQKKKVLLAKSLSEQAHLYIWDEPLNFIDIVSRMQIEKLLLEYQPTILFVEHDRTFCEKVANKVVNLTLNM